MKLKAYAKINLTLDVTGRREDGYHTLDTVMQSVSVWDEIEIKKINKPGIRLFCNREYLRTRKTQLFARRSISFNSAASQARGCPYLSENMYPAGLGWEAAAQTRRRCCMV